MSQKDFAHLMGVTQGMISRWESGEYNFTIKTLTEICEKLKLDFSPSIRENEYRSSDKYVLVDINSLVLKVESKAINQSKFFGEEVSA